MGADGHGQVEGRYHGSSHGQLAHASANTHTALEKKLQMAVGWVSVRARWVRVRIRWFRDRVRRPGSFGILLHAWYAGASSDTGDSEANPASGVG